MQMWNAYGLALTADHGVSSQFTVSTVSVSSTHALYDTAPDVP
ncbi:Uncharacterised protein [Mycobacteroides abscessus subsp. abscessus]|nr:Uncharacterised protein [Mycobacteroides abscessus subsp. abscessus]